MSTAPLTFTGVSTFSNDLQTILTRAVSIAQIPIKQLQGDQADLLQRKQLLTGLNGVVDALGFSVAALGTIGANKGLAATSSDTTKISVVNTGATQPTTYTITNITSIAKAASETSLSGYADTGTTAVSSSGTLQLVYGGTTYPITLAPGQNNLAGLRDAINALGVGVTASILTTGTGTTPNYLTVTANSSGATTLKLQDLVSGSPVDLLTSANQGANTVLTLNGVPVTKSTTLINDVIPGLSFTILSTTGAGQTVTLSLATDRTQLSAALSDFVHKYNAVVDQVNAQSGQGAGPLAGDYVIRQVQDDLRQLTAYRGDGTVNSLVLLGISLDKTGKMSFDSSAFNALSNGSDFKCLQFSRFREQRPWRAVVEIYAAQRSRERSHPFAAERLRPVVRPDEQANRQSSGPAQRHANGAQQETAARRYIACHASVAAEHAHEQSPERQLRNLRQELREQRAGMNSAEHLLRELDAISNRIGAATTIEELEPLVLAQESMLRRIAVIDPRELGPAAAAPSLQNALLASAGARNTLLAERRRVALEWREVSQLQAALTSITQSRPDHRTVSVEL